MSTPPDNRNDIEILVVEDSATQARQLARLLETAGYRVRVAADGRAGLEAVRQTPPTLVVTDIAMPRMDGFEMCKAIKQDEALRDIPVILLTSLSSLYDVIKGLDCGADNFIRKPFEADYLLGRIRFILANRALRSNERVQLGMKINLGGQTHFITAERQQIFDLLISTYEEAIHMTEQLRAQQERIAHSYQSLEGLYRVAEAINPVLSEQDVAERALDRVLDLPRVSGATIHLLDHDGKPSFAVARDASGAVVAPCDCAVAPGTGQPAVVARATCRGEPSVRVPLTTGVRSRGMMCLTLADGTLADDDRQVLETVGSQIAVAIERAHLYGNMERLVDERTAALESERALLSAVVNLSGALVCVLDGDGNIRLFNPACEQSSGWRADEVLGRPFRDLFRRADSAPVEINASPAGAVPVQQSGEWVARDGSVRQVIWSSTMLRRADGAVQYVVTTGMDVTELRRAEESLRYLSNFDRETGLPNDVLLRDRVRQMQARVIDGKPLLGLMLLRLTRLQVIRATLGLDAEQALLRQVAARLGELGEADLTVARTGERTFALAVLRANEAELAALARHVLERMDQVFVHGDEEVHLDPCVGIALFPNDADDYDGLTQDAEAALQRALASKDERYAFYRPELNDGVYERFRFENALRRALERDELVVYFQPQASLSTGRIIGFEALLRWQHPEQGLIPPGRFIALAEETGLILAIGERVLRRACEQCCAWQRAGLRAVPVSVNLSARQFSERVVETVGRILAETGLEPRLLELELTESASMEDPQKTVDILCELKAMGVRLAIDDFGTGYSNLNYLKRFPVDRLKLDQSFVRDLTSDPDDLAIARAVVAMGHGLRLEVIAEGVETEGQLALLAQNGCDEIQGYLFGRPAPADECARMLRDDKALDLGKLSPQPYHRTLLYVDDEVNLLTAIRRSMRQNGYRVLVASSAREAFEILATTEVGVIVCDQRMRGMSGTEFLARVKQMYPAAVRMVLSGYTDLQSVTDAVNRGAIFKFLTKPWIDEELEEAVREAFVEFEAKRGTTGR
ncbi:EAL domain-containing protein [Massilia pinisoli]|uniref:EAL domain-containing protein n=1 Tax=Massilia pinisoli TaxID=1772194 RepID=A0ABT1ZLE7_9BURK|nr:EAL domain-containing protein [Massilia pinisoli]MCS0580748.1 EAL domain-containing protein [Massilia pinisoli]